MNEADLHARHQWLVDQADFRERMKIDPEYFDAKVAGWWVWGICQWIGSGWCSRPDWRGRTHAGAGARGVHTKRPRIGRGGRGISRKIPDIGGAHGNAGRGIHASGVSRQLPDLAGDSGAVGRGVHASAVDTSQGGVLDWMLRLQERLRYVRVCCGDWKRILGPAPTTCIGVTAVFLDPPYADTASRTKDIYSEDSLTVAHEVREWAIANGDNPMLRIALCGYEGEHEMPDTWVCVPWKAIGGYGSRGAGRGKENAARERIWFSPACLKPESQLSLFDGLVG